MMAKGTATRRKGLLPLLSLVVLTNFEASVGFQTHVPRLFFDSYPCKVASIGRRYGSSNHIYNLNFNLPGNRYVSPLLGRYTSSSLKEVEADENENGHVDLCTKQQLVGLYRVGQNAFGLAFFILLFMPDRTGTILLAKKLAGAAGFGVAAGLCYILGGACGHDRLSSDTYKRLNLGLFGFSALGLAALPGESQFLASSRQASVMAISITAIKFYGAILSIVGWKRGVRSTSLNEDTKELGTGILSSLKSLRVEDSKKALTYRNCLILVLMGIVSNFLEGLFYIRYRTSFGRQYSWFDISLQWSAVSRLVMLSTMILSLKDAAERDRLAGTTFIQLNILVGSWSFLVAIGQSVHPYGFAGYRGVEMFAFSLPFFLKALKFQIEKTKKSK